MNKKPMNITNAINKRNSTIIFLSPHLDDALFSAYGAIEELNKGSKLMLISIFTRASNPPHTLSAKRFLSIMGYKNAKKLYEDRQEEDKKVCRELHIKCLHLGYQDALFRKYNYSKSRSRLGSIIPEAVHLYPFFRSTFGRGIIHARLNQNDNKLVNELKTKFAQLNTKNTIFFVPLSIGGHIDHKITKLASEKNNFKIIYYCDIPYIYHNPLPQKMVSTMKLRKHTQLVDLKKKTEICKMYKTQFEPVFKDHSLKDEEVYYINKNAYEYLKPYLR